MQCEMKQGGVSGVNLIRQVASVTWRKGGVRAYFRGLGWGLVGQYPYSAIDLTCFEYIKRWWIRRRESQGFEGKDAHPTAGLMAMMGGFSGAFGASLVWPLNLLRTRLQTSGTVLHSRQYNGIIDVFRQTVNAEGWRGLFKGMTPNIAKVVPSAGITWAVYETSKQALSLP